MNKGGTLGDPLNAALVRGGEATRQSRIIRFPYQAAMKRPGWEMGMRQWVCAHTGAVVANLSFGDALRVQTDLLLYPEGAALCPSPATATTVREARELREPDLRDKRMVAVVVLYKIPVSGAYFTGSNGAWICWPFVGRGPEGFTVQSRRGERDAPSLALGTVQRRRGQAFLRERTD